MTLIDRKHLDEAPAGADAPGLLSAVGALAGRVGCIDDDVATAKIAWRALSEARQVERRLAEQQARIAELERLAATDALTGLLNRRGFEDALSRTLAEAARHDEGGVLIYVDLDGFKPINDHHGHAAGDAVLTRVADLLRDHVRGSDLVGRLGGDEFAVLLTRTDWQGGLARAEAIDALVNAATLDWQGTAIAVRASLGFQPYGPGDQAHALLAGADEAMYRSKRVRVESGLAPNRAAG